MWSLSQAWAIGSEMGKGHAEEVLTLIGTRVVSWRGQCLEGVLGLGGRVPLTAGGAGRWGELGGRGIWVRKAVREETASWRKQTSSVDKWLMGGGRPH